MRTASTAAGTFSVCNRSSETIEFDLYLPVEDTLTQNEVVDIAHLEALAESLVSSHDALMSELIRMRKKHGLSQEAVAERMGVSQPTVAAFERYDANPTLASVRRYALAVDASITHSVVDYCTHNRSEPFRMVIVGESQGWRTSDPIDWSWSAGSVIAPVVLADQIH